MEQKINKTIKNLRLQYLLFWLVPLLLIAGYEAQFLQEGMFADDPQMQYMWETIGILLVIACVPASLKLFSFVLKKKIDAASFPVALKKYETWSAIRLGILELAVLLNIVVYYFTLNNIGGFCALIGLAASLFCFPSENRLRQELYITND